LSVQMLWCFSHGFGHGVHEGGKGRRVQVGRGRQFRMRAREATVSTEVWIVVSLCRRRLRERRAAALVLEAPAVRVARERCARDAGLARGVRHRCGDALEQARVPGFRDEVLALQRVRFGCGCEKP